MLLFSSATYADYKTDIGYDKLVTELGIDMPDGTNVSVSQSEAASSYIDHDNNPTTASWPVYLPDQTHSGFLNDSIIDRTGLATGSYSAHARNVGLLFYGSTAMAAGINNIDAYWADLWLQSNFLNYGSSSRPLSSSARIGNHSWIANISDTAAASNILRRVDWVIHTDEFLQIVGTANGIGTNRTLLSSAYNVLAVGKTDGNHSTGSPNIDSDYPADRTRTEIVAPQSDSSSATPLVSATAALLIEVAHSNPVFSTDPVETSTTNRNNNIIYNAERSEVIKAAILAGADRYTLNTSTTANIIDYRVDITNQTSNGLDARFGAGQVNVYNSYHIIAAGEQNSVEDGGTGSTGIGVSGFDYDPSFGGLNSSNTSASYYFSTGATPRILSASLLWNINIDSGSRPNSFSGTATFYDLDLLLYDVTDGQTLLLGSTSQFDNAENIWTTLNADHDYMLKVIPKSGQSSFNWDYALAWQMISDLDGDGISDLQDNCQTIANTDQADMDNDGIGDECDIDIDSDGDGISDLQDNCQTMANTNQLDLDNDGLGDVCDLDIDGDGVLNTVDTFPYDPAETVDTDGDSIGNNADTDDDNDGLTDVFEVSIGTNSLLVDSDGDGLTDYVEVAWDGDGLSYNSSTDLNPLSSDTDSDGIFDNIDPIPLNYNYADGDVGPIDTPDSVINASDLIVMQQILLGERLVTTEILSHADLYPIGAPDGIINLSDYVMFNKLLIQ